MAIKSNNTQGNPYHDESTGEFTTANGGSAKQEETTTLKSEIPESSPTPKLKLKEGVDLEALRKKISERQQLGKIPYLQSSSEIENHIEEFFPEMMIRDIEKIYDFDGKRRGQPYNYAFFKFEDGSDGLRSNLFVQLFSKYRYPQQYCDFINNQEYNHLVSIINNQGSGKFNQYYDYGDKTAGLDTGEYRNLNKLAKNPDIGCGLVKGYRGVNFQGYSDWQSKLRQCLDSYIGLHSTQPAYSGQGCYGTVNYVAMEKSYARSYDGSYGHVMKHIIDLRNANIMYEPEVRNIQAGLINNSSSIQSKLEQHFSKYMDSDKAQRLATGVVGSIKYDFGFTCVLMGGDVVVAGIGNGNQMDILNWKVAKILKDW